MGDKSNTINPAELQALLDEVKDKCENPVAEVPPQVTEWVFKQADVTCTGSLNRIELARALCAFELWAGKKNDPDFPDPLLKQVAGVRDQPEPERPKSSCCVLL